MNAKASRGEEIVEEHISPDLKLRFIVTAPNDDLTMGFVPFDGEPSAGYPAHTHGDILASLAEGPLTPVEATRQYVDDLINSRSIIAMSIVHGTIRDIWIAADATYEAKYLLDGETMAFRLWDGTVIDGVVLTEEMQRD